MIYVERSASVTTMESMGDRLRAARVAAKFTSATRAADALGVAASTYRAHENGQNEYGPEEAERYARKFATTAAYLLTGSGAKERPSLVTSFDPDGDSNGNGYNHEHWSPSFPGALPEIDVKLGAGEGSIGEMINLRVGDDTFAGHKVLAEWLMAEDFVKHEAKASPRNTVIMEVIGDSMVPTYQPGDRVMVDMVQTRMLADTVYAISDGTSEPQIKRLQRIPFSDPVRVKIISDNPALETFEVDLDRLTIIGRVCGHIAKR